MCVDASAPQDDYLDCYGDEKTIGKIGTDIQDNKCSWLVVQALTRCSPAQRALPEANYGRNDTKCVAAVKQLYAELKLADVFARYEDDTHKQLQAAIARSTAVPPAVFQMFLSKIFKRAM